MIEEDDLVLAGRGAADSPHRELVDPKARAIVRYADPAAWITAAAVARVVVPAAALLDPIRHEVGIVVVSDDGPEDTMGQVEQAAEAGYSSPLRYAAASPGSLAGVACIAFGFRGPTLNLAMPPGDGIPVVLLMSRSWLTRGAARAVVLAVFRAAGRGVGHARAVLVGRRSDLGGGEPFRSAAAWLGQADG